jgi:hypothetical protein
MTSTPLDIDRARLLYVIRHKGKLPGERVYPNIQSASAPRSGQLSAPAFRSGPGSTEAGGARRWWQFWRRKPEPTTFARALAIHIGNNDPKSALK